MELKLWKEYEDKRTGYTSRTYRVEDTIQQENFCDLLESFEDATTCFYYCVCNSYNENGFPTSPTFKDIGKMRVCPFDSADVSFMANFIDRETQEYKFSVISSINSTTVDVDYKPTMVSVIRRKLATDKMFEDLKNRERQN